MTHPYPSRCGLLLFSEEKEEEVIDVDDTDGVDPAGEFDVWRLREFARIKQDKEAEIAHEQECKEVSDGVLCLRNNS